MSFIRIKSIQGANIKIDIFPLAKLQSMQIVEGNMENGNNRSIYLKFEESNY